MTVTTAITDARTVTAQTSTLCNSVTKESSCSVMVNGTFCQVSRMSASTTVHIHWLICRVTKNQRPLLSLYPPHPTRDTAQRGERLLSGGRIGENAVTIPNGSDLKALGGLHRSKKTDGPLRLIVAGRISPEKGIHTVISAISFLKEYGSPERVQLTLIGDGPEDYVSRMRDRLSTLDLGDQLVWMDPLPLDAYRHLLAEHDVLLFPSTWDEPLSSTMIEAMAMGLLVIGTDTGGSREVLVQGETGLVFPPGDARALANAISRLLERPESLDQIAARGEDYVRGNYAMERMLDRIEAHLLSLLQQKERS